MSDFWTLWNKADAGDVGAEQQVNMLVARQAGALVDRTGFVDSGEIRFKDDAGKVFPDYMNDLNAAAGLALPHGMHMVIATVNSIIFADDCNVRVFKFGVHEHLVVVHSKFEARARVGAWWAAVTGEVKP